MLANFARYLAKEASEGFFRKYCSLCALGSPVLICVELFAEFVWSAASKSNMHSEFTSDRLWWECVFVRSKFKASRRASYYLDAREGVARPVALACARTCSEHVDCDDELRCLFNNNTRLQLCIHSSSPWIRREDDTPSSTITCPNNTLNLSTPMNAGYLPAEETQEKCERAYLINALSVFCSTRCVLQYSTWIAGGTVRQLKWDRRESWHKIG